MRSLLIFLTTLMVCNLQAQFGKLSLSLSISNEETTCTKVSIVERNGAILLNSEVCEFEKPMRFDSLQPGDYTVKLSSTEKPEMTFTKQFHIDAGEKTALYIDITTELSSTKDSSGIASIYKSEGEFTLGYMNDKFMDPKSVFTNAYMVGISNHYWNAYRKHLGFMMGFGASYRYNKTDQDTSFVNAVITNKKIKEYYSYLSAQFDLKIRLSAGNQQSNKNPGLFVDLGVLYNFPVYFRYIAKYEGNKKINNQFIHQYTDLRALINVGVRPFVFFAEYRLMDFVISPYPEMPKALVGIRLTGMTVTARR